MPDIDPAIRDKHVHIVGKTGMGKSSLIAWWVYHDIVSRRGAVCVIDPKGIRLVEFAREHGFTLKWRQEAVNLKHTINPDAIATLTTPKGSFTFCIEPERQSFTENHLKKAKKYHGVFETPEAERLFGAQKFRVIFIVLSERKRQTMLEKFAEEYPYRMFWLTTIEAFTNDIGGEIFKTPKDYAERSYSFLNI